MTWSKKPHNPQVKESGFYVLQLTQWSQQFLSFAFINSLVFNSDTLIPCFFSGFQAKKFMKYCFVPMQTYSFKSPNIFSRAFNRTVWNQADK